MDSEYVEEFDPFAFINSTESVEEFNPHAVPHDYAEVFDFGKDSKRAPTVLERNYPSDTNIEEIEDLSNCTNQNTKGKNSWVLCSIKLAFT